MLFEIVPFVTLAVQSNKPRIEGACRIGAVCRSVTVDQLPLFPSSHDPLEFQFKISLGLGIRVLACERTVNVVYCAEVVSVLSRNDGQLVMRVSRIRIYISSQVVIPYSGPPLALLVVAEFGFAVSGEVAQLNEGLVAGLQDLALQRSGNALTVGGSGSVILPRASNLAQLGNALKLGVQVQYVLAIEALAGFDELQIVLLQLSDLDDALFRMLLQLSPVSPPSPRNLEWAYRAVFLSEDGVHLEVSVPELRLSLVGRSQLKVGEEHILAGDAVPGGVSTCP